VGRDIWDIFTQSFDLNEQVFVELVLISISCPMLVTCPSLPPSLIQTLLSSNALGRIFSGSSLKSQAENRSRFFTKLNFSLSWTCYWNVFADFKRCWVVQLFRIKVALAESRSASLGPDCSCSWCNESSRVGLGLWVPVEILLWSHRPSRLGWLCSVRGNNFMLTFVFLFSDYSSTPPPSPSQALSQNPATLCMSVCFSKKAYLKALRLQCVSELF
jgi:hypothetical protein